MSSEERIDLAANRAAEGKQLFIEDIGALIKSDMMENALLASNSDVDMKLFVQQIVSAKRNIRKNQTSIRLIVDWLMYFGGGVKKKYAKKITDSMDRHCADEALKSDMIDVGSLLEKVDGLGFSMSKMWSLKLGVKSNVGFKVPKASNLLRSDIEQAKAKLAEAKTEYQKTIDRLIGFHGAEKVEEILATI